MRFSPLWPALAIFVLSACATDSRSQEYDELAATAKQEIELADKAGFLWLDTEKFVQEAEIAKNAGNLDKAIELITTAIQEARLAQKQARDQAHPTMSFPQI